MAIQIESNALALTPFKHVCIPRRAGEGGAPAPPGGAPPVPSGHAGGGARRPAGGAAGAAARPELPARSAGAEDGCATLCQGGQEEEGSVPHPTATSPHRHLTPPPPHSTATSTLRPALDLAGQAIIKSSLYPLKSQSV